MLTEEREHKPGLAKREFCPCRECALFTSATIIACERKLALYTHFRNYACFSKVASVSKKATYMMIKTFYICLYDYIYTSYSSSTLK
ncbi:hypothetical protein BRARA_B01302 [Brassica rapa]|uniref:Uncharacterized protein n=1 Tax=Brassica campestris TaxID=3711 RepID=A0A398AFZ4_BRACM|nr:hypothetical protein BRARA_B01302 [Brassica rapa]